MSITFSIDNAATQRVQPYPDDEPDFWINEPVAPFVELNMSNGNALAILQLISPANAEDYCGGWNQADLAKVRATIIRVLNTKEKERAYVDPFIDAQVGRCTFIVGGRDASYVESRLNQMLNLVKVAMDHGYDVSWG